MRGAGARARLRGISHALPPGLHSVSVDSRAAGPSRGNQARRRSSFSITLRRDLRTAGSPCSSAPWQSVVAAVNTSPCALIPIVAAASGRSFRASQPATSTSPRSRSRSECHPRGRGGEPVRPMENTRRRTRSRPRRTFSRRPRVREPGALETQLWSGPRVAPGGGRGPFHCPPALRLAPR